MTVAPAHVVIRTLLAYRSPAGLSDESSPPGAATSGETAEGGPLADARATGAPPPRPARRSRDPQLGHLVDVLL